MKMTSRIYGIAVKETVDYYEYDDIKLVFNQDTKQWSIFSNYDNLWMNGVQYHKGDLVVMFADGKVDTYTMMAQYTDTTPYINYMYTITSNFVINPSYYQNGRIEYIFEADPETEPYQFTCKKLLNNVQEKSYTLTDVDIKTYKNQNHGKLPTLFDNMKVDWHGMNPESPYLPYSFTIISNSNYIKDGTTPKQINDIIIQIPAGSGASSYFHRILDETNKHEATPKPGELPSILMTKKIGKYNAKPSVTFNRETIIRKIYHDHTKVYYNGHYHRAMYLVYDSTGAQGCWKKTIEGLAFTYADPFWLCMTTSAGIELGGQVLEAKRLVRCWKDTDDINLTMRKTKSRKKAAPETAPYDDIIYDVVSNASNVTVTKYRRKTKIDAQGHKTTEDIQEDLPIVFDTGDSPVRCWNIEFRAKNNVWTIYSKCGYIRYGGRQYPKNRSILDFNAGEEMHIEIKDETEKYEVDEIITYTVTNVMVTKFIYKVWTVGESYTIKVEKSAENVDPEPWVTVNFYDAWNEHPVVIDDIQLDYDIKTNIWTLSSASDELYYYGNKINKGEKIAEWGFNTIISLKDDRGINVIAANAEKDVKVHIDSTKSQPQGLDISEFYPSNDYYNVDFLLTHSVTKGEWVITSKRDDTYMNGVRYTYNKVIFQGSDKQGYPEFTFMCQHKKDESGPIIPTRNIMYTITISWDPYEQIGNLAVQALGGESKVYYTREKDPAKNTIVLTKQNAKSMYGYIWKRDMPGPGPEPGDHYCWYIVPIHITSEMYSGLNIVGGNGYNQILLIRTEFGKRRIIKVIENSTYNAVTLLDKWIMSDNLKNTARLAHYSDFGNLKILYDYTGEGSPNAIESSNYWRYNSSSGHTDSTMYPYPYNTYAYTEDESNYQGYFIKNVDNGKVGIMHLINIYETENDMQKVTVSLFVYHDRILSNYCDRVDKADTYFNLDSANSDWGIYIGNQSEPIEKEGYVIFDSDYIVYFYEDRECVPERQRTNPRNCYAVSKVDLETLEVIGLHKTNNFSKGSWLARYGAEQFVNAAVFVNYYFTYLGKRLIGIQTNELVVHMTYYLYDIEENSFEYLSEYTYPLGQVPPPEAPSNVARIPQFIRNGKGYSYEDYNYESLIIREIDPDNINDVLSGGTILRTINYDTEFQLYNIVTGLYETFTYRIFNYGQTAYSPNYNAGMWLNSIYYSTISRKVTGEGDGLFRATFISGSPDDLLIMYFPDPSFESLSGAFCFRARDMRWQREWDETWLSQN